jgi:hypothetical protein
VLLSICAVPEQTGNDKPFVDIHATTGLIQNLHLSPSLVDLQSHPVGKITYWVSANGDIFFNVLS